MPVFDVPDILPVGSGLLWYSGTPPSKYLLCDGTAISRTTYAQLFGILGTTYGVGDGSTTFNLPDLRQKFPIGKAASGTGNSLGGTGGTIDHDHSVPAHYHSAGTLANSTTGAHTHSIDHDHASFTSGGSGTLTTTSDSHSHTFSGTTGSTSTNQFPGRANSSAGNTAKAMRASSAGSDNNTFNTYFDHSHSFSGTTSTDTHDHTIPTHTHPVNVPAFTGSSGSAGDHTHTISGSAGNTGGVDGDSAMTSGANNPPFLVVNYIIKYA